jgi:hypothetical protein
MAGSTSLTAARALPEARECQMITRLEWEALAAAVAEATPSLDETQTYEGFLEVWSDVCLASRELLPMQSLVFTASSWRTQDEA